jgi:hypothetical protein
MEGWPEPVDAGRVEPVQPAAHRVRMAAERPAIAGTARLHASVPRSRYAYPNQLPEKGRSTGRVTAASQRGQVWAGSYGRWVDFNPAQVRDIDLENGVLHVAFNYVVKGGMKA